MYILGYLLTCDHTGKSTAGYDYFIHDCSAITTVRAILIIVTLSSTYSRAVGTIAAIAAMAATLFSNYLTCDIQNALIKLAALQYTFLWPCLLVIIASLSCYPMRDSMGLVARPVGRI